MNRRRPTARATITIAAAIVVVALVLVLLPTGSHTPAPDDKKTDLLADVQRFSQAMSAESGYTRPSRTERATLSDGVRRVLDNVPGEAGDVLAQVGYTVREHVDAVTRRTFYDISDTAAAPRGWGRIMVDTAAADTRLGIEIPHPKADQDSEALGVELFRKAAGSVLVIAGAHRRAAPDRQADMAHTTDSVFEEIHALLVQRRTPVVQLHGFQNETAPDSDVVVSAGPRLRSPYVQAIAQRLEAAGLSVCRPWVTGCPGLEATTNVQAQWSQEHGADFAHVEVSRDMRDTSSSRDLVVSALAGQQARR